MGKGKFWRREDPIIECPVCNQTLVPDVERGHDGRSCPDHQIKGRVAVGGMFHHQRAWWDLENKVKMLVTGYGGGKTMTLCKRLISSTLVNAPVLVAAVSPTFSMAEETIIATLIELLAGRETLDPTFSWDYNRTHHLFTIRYGPTVGRLKVYSGEDPLKLRGPNLAAIGIDEPFIQDEEVFHQMIFRLRHPHSKKKEILLTGTPEQLNWGYELAEGELGERHDVGIIQASTDSNLALEGDYLDQLDASLSGKALDAYRHGAFVNLAKGAVYYAFDPMRHIVDRDPPQYCNFGIGMDFGAAKDHATMASVLFWHTSDHIHFYDEIEQANSDTPTMCAYLARNHPGVDQVYPDATGNRRQSASGTTDFRVLRDNDFEVNVGPVNPQVRDRIQCVNWLLSKDRMTIHPRCKSLKKYLSQLSHEQIKKQKDMTHLTDALGYPAYRIFPPAPTGLQKHRLGSKSRIKRYRKVF